MVTILFFHSYKDNSIVCKQPDYWLACDLRCETQLLMSVDKLVWNIQHGAQINPILLGLSQISSFLFRHRSIIEIPCHPGILMMILNWSDHINRVMSKASSSLDLTSFDATYRTDTSSFDQEHTWRLGPHTLLLISTKKSASS